MVNVKVTADQVRRRLGLTDQDISGNDVLAFDRSIVEDQFTVKDVNVEEDFMELHIGNHDVEVYVKMPYDGYPFKNSYNTNFASFTLNCLIPHL